jgi:fatty-acyl-CoA synthase
MPCDWVGVLDWNSQRHFELYWAIPGIAAVMMQMNPRLGSEDLGFVIQHSDATFIVVDETLLPVAETIALQASRVKGSIVLTDAPLAAIKSTESAGRQILDSGKCNEVINITAHRNAFDSIIWK